MLSPTSTPQPIKKFALFELGFRPFFLLGCVFSIIATLFWMAMYTFGWSMPMNDVSPIAWHGHEMVFGYATAVIAGFLLTAVRNWTGVATINGVPLLLLLLTWLLARILSLSGSPLLFVWAAFFDILFLLGFLAAMAYPIAKSKQWQQSAIISKILLILIANILYYLGAFHILDQGISWGLFSGVYIIIALIFTLARRVMPFFIERGVGYEVKLKNSSIIDSSSLFLLAALWISDVFLKQALLTTLFSFALAIVHSIRLYGWYTKGIWKKPLLWVLFLAYGMLILGFVLLALNYFRLYPTTIPLHAFTYGGIGMMTLGMMARISLGHTARNINKPPAILAWIFSILFIGALARVVMPIFIPSGYIYWIGLAQLSWIIAFTLFVYSYFRILIEPRVDGAPG